MAAAAIILSVSTDFQDILNRALALPPADKARIANELLKSLGEPDEAIDGLWRKEVEDRIAAYKAGDVKIRLARRSSCEISLNGDPPSRRDQEASLIQPLTWMA
jgi:hypothetical protein